MQVKVKNWVDGKEGDVYGGMSARFGSILPEKADQSPRSPAISSNPTDCCSTSTPKVFISISFSLNYLPIPSINPPYLACVLASAFLINSYFAVIWISCSVCAWWL